MKIKYYLFPIVMLILALSPLSARDLKGSIEFKGEKRSFLVHLPPRFEAGKKFPLVVALHGGGGSGRKMKRFSRFDTIADREGFIVAYPDGIGRQWNDGRTIAESRAHSENIDDIGFLSGLVDYMIRKYGADAKRVYFAGISNGALMSYRMACEAPEKIAAIAAVTGNLPEHLSAVNPRGPVAVMIINGTDDPLVPWNGGPVRVPFAPRKERGRVLSMAGTAAFWARANGCPGRPGSDELPDVDTGDGCRVIRHAYAGCGKADLVYYEVKGGGHTWPGGPQYLPVKIVGRTCRDFNASEKIWEFFKSHEKK